MSLNKFPVRGKPVTDPAAQTQTTLTHAVGTADATVDDVGAAFSQTTLNNNFKEITTELALIKADVAALRTYIIALNAALGVAN
jgi:hypothetical protein